MSFSHLWPPNSPATRNCALLPLVCIWLIVSRNISEFLKTSMYPEFPRESTNILPRKNGSLLQTIVIRNCQEDKTTMLSRSLPASKAVMPTDVDPLNTLRHLLFLKRLSFSLECAIPRAERGARAIPL